MRFSSCNRVCMHIRLMCVCVEIGTICSNNNINTITIRVPIKDDTFSYHVTVSCNCMGLTCGFFFSLFMQHVEDVRFSYTHTHTNIHTTLYWLKYNIFYQIIVKRKQKKKNAKTTATATIRFNTEIRWHRKIH